MEYPTDLKTKNKGHSETTKLEIYDVTPFRSTFENVIFFSNDEQQLNFFETNTQFLHSIYKSNNFQFLPEIIQASDIFTKEAARGHVEL